MPNVVVAGAQWGDEGKGKIVDLLAEKVQIVARYNGGHNAGHTVIVGERQFILHLIPSGVLHPGLLCVMGNGMVVDPVAFEKEIADLRAGGIEVGDNLRISDRAHLILPHHRELESLAESLRGARKIGTTQRGIGPAYEDKVARRGLRMGDVLAPARLPDRLAEAQRHYELICRGSGTEPRVDWKALVDELAAFGERQRERIVDVSVLLHREMAAGSSVLFEGAQATLLDVDFGTYPFVTSSSACAAGAATGLGVPPTRIDATLGIVKAFTTRVGAGPLPTEIGGDMEEQIRSRGGEYGASTGRPRRCGWFDAMVVSHSVRVNGFDSLALTKLDVLDELDEIKICTGYRYKGEMLSSFPADITVLEQCEPVFETMPGWKASTTAARTYTELPENARRYVERLRDLVGTEIGIVSTGPSREQTLFHPESGLTGWFAQ